MVFIQKMAIFHTNSPHMDMYRNVKTEHLIFSLLFSKNMCYRDVIGRVVTRVHKIKFLSIRWYLPALSVKRSITVSIHP